MSDPWLPYYRPVDNAQLRLVAFHWAGGSASGYNGPAWRNLPDGVELLAVQLPGREKRKTEKTPKSAQEAAKLTVNALKRFFTSDAVPTAIFAHSMVSMRMKLKGALELTHMLNREHGSHSSSFAS